VHESAARIVMEAEASEMTGAAAKRVKGKRYQPNGARETELRRRQKRDFRRTIYEGNVPW
jgi:hypothetical protein